MTPDDSDLCVHAGSVGSPYDTAFDSRYGPDNTDFESDSEDVLIVTRNGGDCADFQVHMTGLIRDFFECFRLEDADPEWETFDWGSSWTLSMFLWIRFAHDATPELRDKWLQVTTTHSPNLSILTECLRALVLGTLAEALPSLASVSRSMLLASLLLMQWLDTLCVETRMLNRNGGKT